MQPEYLYRARVINVVDGDTFDAEIDLGFYVKTTQRFRLSRIDTPEVRGKERPKGLLVTMIVEKIFKRFNESVETYKKLEEEYGDLDVLDKRLEKLALDIPSGDVFVKSVKTGKFGRWLGEVYIKSTVTGDVVNLTDWLLEHKLGEPYR